MRISQNPRPARPGNDRDLWIGLMEGRTFPRDRWASSMAGVGAPVAKVRRC